MNFLNDFILLLKARYPIIYISTYEEERIEYIIRLCTKKYVARTYYSWDFINGYQGNPNDSGFAAKNPLEALELVEKLTPETASVFILKDYNNFLKDISITRKLKNLNRDLKTQPKNLIIIAPEINIPESLKEIITVVEFPLPSYLEIQEELKRLTTSLQQEIIPEQLNELTVACQGLSLERIRRVLSKIITQYGEISEGSPRLILEEKKQIIQQSQLLEFCIADKKISDLGGLDNFKIWLKRRDNAFSQTAIDYGLPYPKGVLLVGVQGTGKSLAAKTIANEWKLPLLKLDFGRLFASLVGQSESRVRQMIQTAEALSPCVLWVDEIDKSFSGIQNGGDSGTTSRVLATFITWLSEKTTPVFVVATANNIEWIPPEVVRKGRFDEVFFLALPTRQERQAIFEVHLQKSQRANLENFQIPLLGDLSKDFSGAEIEQVIVDAMRLGFSEQREFTNEDLIVSIQNSVPLAKTKNQELKALQKWAESGNVALASKYQS
jgi:SpoVK/Ycf46/Vps4 family AAA+-type ATPase